MPADCERCADLDAQEEEAGKDLFALLSIDSQRQRHAEKCQTARKTIADFLNRRI